MNKYLHSVVFPVVEVGKVDTSLRYTDILFGFVIKELFVRLQNWSSLVWTVRLHLIVGTVLVLGSWIGYRRSAHRPAYEVKFFNLPFFRFLIDQLMLILYFRIAVLTDLDPSKIGPTAEDLAAQTVKLVGTVFFMYGTWDCLGILMALRRDPDGKWKYPEVKDGKRTGLQSAKNFDGFAISLAGLLMFVLLAFSPIRVCFSPNAILVVTVLLLLAYRFLKEVRTSWRRLREQEKARRYA